MLLEIKAKEVKIGDVILGNKCEGPVESVRVVHPHVMIVFESGEPKATSTNYNLRVLRQKS